MIKRSKVQHVSEVFCPLICVTRWNVFFMRALSKEGLHVTEGENSLQKGLFKQSVMLWPFAVQDVLEIFDPRRSRTSAEGSTLPSLRKERASTLHTMEPLTGSGAIVTSLDTTELQKLDFTSKWRGYWQQQPHPHSWLSHQQNVKWLHQCAELHIWEE